jgi:Na+/proline symporter
VAQRMLAARTERDAMAGTLLFNVAHYALRPWPWIVVALASMIVFPRVDDIRAALPHVDPALVGHDMAYSAMLTFLPHGVLGVMVAGLLAAYVSTISTHLNWGTSYLVHDLYRRFLNPDASERHFVAAGRLVTAALMVAAGLLTLVLESARTTFELLLSIGAGTGLLYLLRWFWWRINAWSEIAAMASSFLLAVTLLALRRQGLALTPPITLVGTVVVTTLVWLIATWATAPENPETLRRFYERVRPAGPGWGPVRQSCPAVTPADDLTAAFVGSAASCAFVYSALFGVGHLLMGHTLAAAISAVVLVVSAAATIRAIVRLWW